MCARAEPIRRDYGDEDLQEALSDATLRRRVALVLFGHMHHRLHPISGCGLRNMAALDPETPTVYLNAAVVPRVEAVRSEAGAELQVRAPPGLCMQACPPGECHLAWGRLIVQMAGVNVMHDQPATHLGPMHMDGGCHSM